MIRYPNITGKNDAQKLDQMKSYLHQLADELNYQLDNTSKIGSGYPSSSVGAGAVAKPVKKDDPISNFNDIKALIIKSADIVDAYSEQISETLRGEYVAVSDFGTYTQETLADLEIGADEIRSSLAKVESIDDDIKNAVQSEIQQTADSITLEVDNGVSTAQIKMKVGDRELDPATIDMTGLVTFSNLSTPNDKTVINGSNITTGQIKADRIKAGVLQSNDGEKIVIDLDNGNVHAVGTFETEWESTDGSSVHTAVSPSGLHIQKGEGTGALHSKFLFHEAYVQKHNTDFTKAEAYMRPYGDPYDSGKSLMGLKHGDVASVENQVGETMLGTAYAQSVYSRGSKTLEVGVNDARTFISGLDAPQYNTDAVNKAYVDGKFAPAGYGIGSNAKIISSLDEVDGAGWYHKWFNPEEMPEGAAYGQWTFRTGIYGSPTYFEIIMPANSNFNDYSVLSELRKRRDDNGWYPWEWVNPPMIPGIEYRTTERWNGHPVYAKTVSCGTLAAGSWKTQEYTGVSGAVLRYSGVCGGTAIPFNPFPVADPNNNVELGVIPGVIYISKGTTCTISGDIYVQVWYVK